MQTLERIRDHANGAEDPALLAQKELDRMTENEWQWSEPEPVSPDDPLVHGERWRQERDDYKDRWETLGRVAKNKIDRLEAENEKLREAISDACDLLDEDGVTDAWRVLRAAYDRPERP